MLRILAAGIGMLLLAAGLPASAAPRTTTLPDFGNPNGHVPVPPAGRPSTPHAPTM